MAALVVPLPARLGGPGPCGWLAVFLADPERAAVPPMAVLAAAYRLTRAEARLLHALIGGETLRDYGERTGITANTVRTHLRQLFLKTETSRQAELVALTMREMFSGLVR